MHQECEGDGMYSPMFYKEDPGNPVGFYSGCGPSDCASPFYKQPASVSLDEYFIVTQQTADAHEELQDV
jgi:hypothetical protein